MYGIGELHKVWIKELHTGLTGKEVVRNLYFPFPSAASDFLLFSVHMFHYLLQSVFSLEGSSLVSLVVQLLSSKLTLFLGPKSKFSGQRILLAWLD